MNDGVAPRLTGRYRDSETGQDFFSARYFGAALGRFTSPDPANIGASMTDPQTWNAYAYARNNPLANVDPTGMQCSGLSGGAYTQCEAEANMYNGGDLAFGWDPFSVQQLAFTPSAIVIQFDGDFQGGDNPNFGSATNMWVIYGNWSALSLIGPLVDQGGSSGPATSGNGNPTRTCRGSARVLQGNAATIGKPGGFSGPSVGTFPVTKQGAAIIPSQWAAAKSLLRPYINQISGVFPQVQVSFQGLVDTIGSTGIPNVQSYLINKNPGKLIIELPGASQDYGVTNVTITVPSALACPAGTVQVP